MLANWVVPALATRDDLRRCLADARRALAPGGRLVSTMSHPDFIDRPHRHYRALVGGIPAAGESHPTRLLDPRGGEVLVTRDVYWPTRELLECALAERLALAEVRDLYDPVDTATDGGVLERVPAYRALVFERLEPSSTGEEPWSV